MDLLAVKLLLFLSQTTMLYCSSSQQCDEVSLDLAAAALHFVTPDHNTNLDTGLFGPVVSVYLLLLESLPLSEQDITEFNSKSVQPLTAFCDRLRSLIQQRYVFLSTTYVREMKLGKEEMEVIYCYISP